MTQTESAAAKEARRDPRLDFFRGLGMFIILIAHIPWNGWNNWIPARFGYSDATEIFVFCSGAASAIAFLKIFEKRGWWIGTMRIGYRIWQLYWCHIAIFFALLTALLVIDQNLDDATRNYVTVLNLKRFVNDPAAFLPALFTLRYVPNYFDILVMYMVILALIPVVVALSRLGPKIAMGFCVALWLLASQPWLTFIDVPVITALNLPANPKGNFITWFFNPFAWQLIFFTGFAFAVGWLPKPPVKASLVILALTILVFSFFMDPDGVPARRLLRSVEALEPLREPVAAFKQAAGNLDSKTYFGLFRYVHFLALAYIVWSLAGDNGKRLPSRGIGGAIVTVVRRVGQQSLAVFIASLLIARIIGVYIAEHSVNGPGEKIEVAQWVTNSANLMGFALIIAVAYIARYFRNPPWTRKTALATTGTPMT